MSNNELQVVYDEMSQEQEEISDDAILLLEVDALTKMIDELQEKQDEAAAAIYKLILVRDALEGTIKAKQLALELDE
jgi:hypothetical protein